MDVTQQRRKMAAERSLKRRTDHGLTLREAQMQWWKRTDVPAAVTGVTLP
jgi:hypothetical protein